MLLSLFLALRAERVPVSLREHLTLIEALEAGEAAFDIDAFYYLCRATLVKDERYFDRFDRELECDLPPVDDPGTNWHMFQPVLPVDRMTISRGEFIRQMHARGIGVGVHYPALHRFTLYRGMGYGDGDFPHAERVGRGIVTLPLFPTMRNDDVDRVCDAVRDILRASLPPRHR